MQPKQERNPDGTLKTYAETPYVTYYKGEKAPKNSSTSGVKQITRGVNRDKYQAFLRSADGDIFQGEPRNTRAEAMLDLVTVKSRIYI